MAFWQQAREQAKRVISRAGAESEKLAAIARLAMELNNVKGDVQRKIADLGAAARKLVQDGAIAHPDLAVAITEIEALEARVKELEQQIAETKAAPARVN